MKQLQKKIKSGTLDLKKDDPFELFISATNIRYCYYAETHKILGNTYGMCVLQVSLRNITNKVFFQESGYKGLFFWNFKIKSMLLQIGKNIKINDCVIVR